MSMGVISVHSIPRLLLLALATLLPCNLSFWLGLSSPLTTCRVGAVPAGWASPDALANGGSATASGLTAMPGALTRASWGTAPHAAQAPGDSFTAATHTPGLYATETLVRWSYPLTACFACIH